MGDRPTFDGWLCIWKDEQGGLLTTDGDEPLVGTFEASLGERLSKAGNEYQGGPLIRTGSEGGPLVLDAGPWAVTQKGRRRIATVTLDGSQGVKAWIKVGASGEGTIRSTSWQNSEERNKGFSKQNADCGHESDARGNLIRKGTPGRSINQRGVDPNTIPF